MSEKLESRVKALGYPSPDHYFIARAGLTLDGMAKELGLSLSTVAAAYRDLLKRAKDLV